VSRYLIRRVLWAIVLFFAVTIISYVLFYVIPADPAKTACGQACTQRDVQRVKHFLGLDKPAYVQYGKFVGRLMPFSFAGGPHFKARASATPSSAGSPSTDSSCAPRPSRPRSSSAARSSGC
jgi:peptide/nickel transport system permease protein